MTTPVPDCPLWTNRAIVEYETAQGYDPLFPTGVAEQEQPRYPELDAQIGEIARVCDALKAANGERKGCNPDTWGEWAALILSLECYE